MTVLDRALVVGDAGQVTGERQERPDPEVPEKACRRTFTAQYKLDVVAEYDAAPTGEKGALLRREGLYSSHVIEWRRARDAGALAGPARQHRSGRPCRSATVCSHGRSHRPSGRRSSARCTRSGSLTLPRPRSGRPCWTRAPTSGRCPLLPAAPPRWRDPRAALAGCAPGRCQARADGHRAEPGLVMGHH
jgi:hypothetical protein